MVNRRIAHSVRQIIDRNFAIAQKYSQIFLLVQAVLQAIPRLLAQGRSRIQYTNPRKVSLNKRGYLFMATFEEFFGIFLFQFLFRIVHLRKLGKHLVGNGLVG